MWRKSGSKLRVHPYQVTSWVIGLFTLATCYSVVLPRFRPPLQVRLTQILFATGLSFLFLLILSLASFLTLTDPTDPLVRQYRSALQRK